MIRVEFTEEEIKLIHLDLSYNLPKLEGTRGASTVRNIIDKLERAVNNG